MLGRPVKIELPRRIVVLYLLYSLGAVLWLVASALFATKSIAVRHAEHELLSNQRRVSTTATLALADDGTASLQPLVASPPLVGRYTFLVLSVPLLLIAMGGFTLHRLVSPLAAVDAQLRQAALAATLVDIELSPIKSRGASVLGWNRIVDKLHTEYPQNGLDRRVSNAVQSLRHGKSDDILNSLTDGVAVCDHECKVTFANQAMAAMFATDLKPDSLRGRDIGSCFAFDAEQECGAALFDPDLFGRPVVEEVERGTGDTRQFLRIARHPISAAQGASSVGHVWTVRDITQRQLANEMRDQFLDNATHELRTPLANIKAYAETLTMGDTIDVETQKEFCNTINAEATRLARFIDDLLSVSSMEAGSLTLNRQSVDLGRLFSEVAGKVNAQMTQKKIDFETIFPAKYPLAKLDKDKVNVALVNLLGNAAKYTPEGGRVRFEVKVTDREIRIEVEDTGVGISEEDLPRICEKFFRSSNPAVQEITGTGLGLSMAQEVIKLHGGHIGVQSKLGNGTTFIATLPLE
ncbi:MAG: ATP-binding protein [Planctomycetota bacterium]